MLTFFLTSSVHSGHLGTWLCSTAHQRGTVQEPRLFLRAAGIPLSLGGERVPSCSHEAKACLVQQLSSGLPGLSRCSLGWRVLRIPGPGNSASEYPATGHRQGWDGGGRPAGRHGAGPISQRPSEVWPKLNRNTNSRLKPDLFYAEPQFSWR